MKKILNGKLLILLFLLITIRIKGKKTRKKNFNCTSKLFTICLFVYKNLFILNSLGIHPRAECRRCYYFIFILLNFVPHLCISDLILSIVILVKHKLHAYISLQKIINVMNEIESTYKKKVNELFSLL